MTVPNGMDDIDRVMTDALVTLLPDGIVLARTPRWHPWRIGVTGRTEHIARLKLGLAVTRRARLLGGDDRG